MASIGLLSTYSPTECGLATFTKALYEHLSKSEGAIGVVRVLDHDDDASPPEVVAHLVTDVAADYAAAAAALNRFDVAIIQHEYGIYGGQDGRDVVELLSQLRVPLVVVLHTVLLEPTFSQRQILAKIIEVADVIVTMTHTARQRVIRLYGATAARVVLIPHGAIDNSGSLVHRPKVERPVILTWGLIGPGKGIEWAIDAMAQLRDLAPSYQVVGKTHPKVRERDGEEYRDMLLQRIRTNEVSDLVALDPSYLSRAELAQLVDGADIVLLPYDSIEQVTSGVLIEAVAAGKPVVSTSFPHAVELLSSGAGLLVEQRDPQGIADALRRVLTEPGLGEVLAANAAKQAPELLWHAVATRYTEIAATLAASMAVA